MSTTNVVLACDKEQFMIWCKGWELDSDSVLCGLVGQSKEPIEIALPYVNNNNVIILSGWNREEYVDEEYCNHLISSALVVCPLPPCFPYIEDGKIVAWSKSTQKVERRKFMLPYVPQRRPGQLLWTAEMDKTLTTNYRKFTFQELAKLIGCSPDAVSNRAAQLHLKKKLDIHYKTTGENPYWTVRYTDAE